MQEFAVDERASADACAYRQIDERVQALSRAPFPFTKRGSVGVGVEGDGNVECGFHLADHIEIRPVGFCRREDEAEGGRGRFTLSLIEGLRVERTEARNPQCGESAKVRFGLFEESNRFIQRFVWSGGWESFFAANVIGRGCHDVIEFCAAALDAAKKFYGPHLSC